MGGSKTEQVPTMSKDQLQVLQQLLGGLQGGLPQGFEALLQQLNPESARDTFQSSVADPALREFQGKVIPSILQSQANLGAKGGRSLERQLAQAGAGLEQGLGEQFAGFQAGQSQTGIENLIHLLTGGLSAQPFTVREKAPSFGQQLGGSALQLAPRVLGSVFGLPGIG